jgi:hypothetical protein
MLINTLVQFEGADLPVIASDPNALAAIWRVAPTGQVYKDAHRTCDKP